MDGLMRAEGSTAGPSSVFPEVNGHHPGITQPETVEGTIVANVVLPEANGCHPVELQVQVIIIALKSKYMHLIIKVTAGIPR